jgi:hypothetical protein
LLRRRWNSNVGERTNTDEQPAARETMLVEASDEASGDGGLTILVLGEQTQLMALGELVDSRRSASQVMELEYGHPLPDGGHVDPGES